MSKTRLEDSELEELKRLFRDVRDEDGHDFVNDLVVFIDEHGEALIRELEVARGKSPDWSFEVK